MIRYFVGLDLGKAHDHSALAILEQVFEIAGQYADVVPANALNFADFGNVDVEMGNVLRVWGESSRISCDAIVKAGANGDQEITVFNRVVG